MNSENLFIVSAVLVHCIYCMTLVHCIYDTCSLCLLEVFTLLVDGRGGTDLEWLGIVPIPSPHFGERKERSMYLNMGNIEEIGERERVTETSVSRGIFGENCVRMAKERLWSQVENASMRQDWGI